MQTKYYEILFNEALRDNGLKITANRRAIFRSLCKANRPLTPQQICISLPQINPSSIYRNLALLAQANIIRTVPRGFRILYEPSEIFIEHHHHIVCEKCGATMAISCSGIEEMLSDLAHQSGVRITDHHIEIFGVCRDCDHTR